MLMFMQEYESSSSLHHASLTSKRFVSTMKNEYDGIPVDIILHEASTVLQAARQHAVELSEVGLTDNELNRMRVLITRVAAHSYTTLWHDINISAEIRELKIVKDVILRAAEIRFGHVNEVLMEFDPDKNPIR
jgi:hypothetical protein